MTPRAASRGKGSGCLETAAIAVFTVLLGAFGVSTWMRHVEDESPAARPSVPDSAGAPPVERTRIRVEVRNGSGIPGAAAQVTEYLRDAGFDVVDFGNAAEFDQARTTVIDRIGVPQRAREVATALRGVPIESSMDSTLFLDVTVVVGRDAPGLVTATEAESGGGWRRWLERARGLWPFGR